MSQCESRFHGVRCVLDAGHSEFHRSEHGGAWVSSGTAEKPEQLTGHEKNALDAAAYFAARATAAAAWVAECADAAAERAARVKGKDDE